MIMHGVTHCLLGLQGSAHVVDLRNTESVQTITFDPPGDHQHNVSGLAFSPKVRTLPLLLLRPEQRCCYSLFIQRPCSPSCELLPCFLVLALHFTESAFIQFHHRAGSSLSGWRREASRALTLTHTRAAHLRPASSPDGWQQIAAVLQQYSGGRQQRSDG